MELRTLRKGDLEQAWTLDRDAFHVPAGREERFRRRLDPTRFEGLFADGRLVAMGGAHGFGQFFGGRSVPMGGLTSVSVAPDQRGKGYGTRVSVAVLEAMRERGEVISSLFPASTSLYRNLGWEVAGAHVWRTVLPRSLQALPRPEVDRVRPGESGDFEAVRACYARCAREVNGFLDRTATWWERLRDTWEDRSLFVAENEGGRVDGYLVYRQIDGEYSALGGPFGIAVDEVVTTNRDSSLALWRLLGSWGTQVERILYRGGAEDPLLLLLPQQELRVVAEVRWMTRLVDPTGAIDARGFAPGVDVEVSLELRDLNVPANEGRFVLAVRKGRGRLEPGGRGDLGLDVGAFSALYTGWATTAALVRAGRLTGDSAEGRTALDAAFAGPTPWMLDEF